MAFSSSLYSLHSTSEFNVPAHIQAPVLARKRSYDGSDWQGRAPKAKRLSWTFQDEPESTSSIVWGASGLVLEEEEELNELDDLNRAASSKEPYGLPPGKPGGNDERALAAEVRRIRLCVGAPNQHRQVLGLEPPYCWNLQLVQSRYRQLMRLLHPDKRSKAAEALAGGHSACDEAVSLVQAALQKAKQEVQTGPDPVQLAQDSMRRMQEAERQRARYAMQRQQQLEVSTLAEDVERALAEVAMPDERAGVQIGFQRPDNTAQEIMSLLAQLAPGQAGS